MNNLDPFTILVGAIFIAIVAWVILKKFGRIITNLLTIFGGLVILLIIYLLYSLLNSDIDLTMLKPLLEMLK